MMVLFRLLPLRAWMGLGALAVALLATWWVYDTYQDARRAEAAVKALQEEIRARDELDRVLEDSRTEAAETRGAVRNLPKRALTADEEAIARRLFQ